MLELNYDELKVNYSGGFLHLIFAGLAALGGIAGGAAVVVNGFVSANHQSAEEEEEEKKIHNLEMEKVASGSAIGVKKKKLKPYVI